VIEDSDVYNSSDWTTFRNTFGLASAYRDGSFEQIHPASNGEASCGGGSCNCADPGVNGDEVEAAIDAQWASAAAPNAAIKVASCGDTATTFGGFIALPESARRHGTVYREHQLWQVRSREWRDAKRVHQFPL
jgi:hypothetical protein